MTIGRRARPKITTVRRTGLRWYGHVERKCEEELIKRATTVTIDVRGPLEGQTRARETVAADWKALHLGPSDAADKADWRQAVNRDPSNLGVPGRMTTKRR